MAEENYTAEAVGMADSAMLTDVPLMMLNFRRNTVLKIETVMSAIVIRYDRKTHKAYVQPLPKIKSNAGEYCERKPFWVRVHRMQAGGFLIDPPLFVGDVGWVVASARSNLNVVKRNGNVQEKDSGIGKSEGVNLGPQNPNTDVLTSYVDGFFIPDCWAEIDVGGDNLRDKEKLPKIKGESYDDCLVIQRIAHDKKAESSVVFKPNGDVDMQSYVGRLCYNGHPIYPGNASAFDYLNREFHNCCFQYGRSFYTVSNADEYGTVSANLDGVYYLTIPAKAPQAAELKRYETAQVSDLVHTVIPIARIYEDEMVQDFRGCPTVPVYEDGTYKMNIPKWDKPEEDT